MRYLQQALIVAAIFFPISASADERPTVVVGGPYHADVAGAASLSHRFGMMIMKPMFNADVTLLTSTERDIILSKKGTTGAVIPIPLDDAVRFVSGLLKANEWCLTLNNENVAGSKTVDVWSWETLPVRYPGNLKRTPMGMQISVVAETAGSCSVKLDGKGAYPMPFVAYFPANSIEHLIEDITEIPAAAAILDEQQTRKKTIIEQLK